MNNKNIILILCFLFAVIACNKQNSSVSKDLGGYQFYNKAAGSKAISEDKDEGFFDRMTIADVCLQLGMPPENFSGRADAVEAYRNFISANVEEFTKEEKTTLRSIFDEIVKTLGQDTFKRLFPKTVGLIKIAPEHYGPSVFYTRESLIVIPNNIFGYMPKQKIKEIMLHELFHVYSRNLKSRTAVYNIVGYFPAQHPGLNERTVLNPDGLDMGYGIQLEQDTFWNFLEATPKADYKAPFFGNVIIGYVNQKGEKSIRIPQSLEKSYYEQIGKNTNYIIHPDEVLADNFIIWYKVFQERTMELSKVESPEIIKALDIELKK